jgi:hypothetical protein
MNIFMKNKIASFEATIRDLILASQWESASEISFRHPMIWHSCRNRPIISNFSILDIKKHDHALWRAKEWSWFNPKTNSFPELPRLPEAAIVSTCISAADPIVPRNIPVCPLLPVRAILGSFKIPL